jgi:phosphate:Na+ symporter
MDLFPLVSGLFGGLALFLLGLNFLTRSLEILAGERMAQILEQLTKNRLLGVLTGALTTAAVNSSTVTTVLLVGFVSAGLMTMSQSIAVVMGANIGSTVTAQILAFNIGVLALPLIALGFLASMVGKTDRSRESGRALLGAGLVFYGMQVMSEGMAPLRGHEPFIQFMAEMQRPVMGVLAGAVFTAVVQSSAATLGLVIIMASQDIIDLPAAIAIALGSNIGTCLTAGLAAIGKPREAVRVFVAHLLFNVVGAVLWLPFIGHLADLATWLTPGSLPREIANAHTLFNIVNTLLFIGFTTQIAWLIQRLVPEPTGATSDLLAPRYLDQGLQQSPSLALGAARRELARLAEQTVGMVEGVLPSLVSRDPDRLATAHDLLPRLRRLNEAIIVYLGEIGRARLGERQSAELTAILQTSQFLMSIAELAGDDLLRLANRRERWPGLPDTALQHRIDALLEALLVDVRSLPGFIASRDLGQAVTIREGKHAIHGASRDLTRAAFERVAGSHDPRRTKVYSSSVETMEILGRIHRLCRKMAKLELDLADGDPEQGAAAPPPADSGKTGGPDSAAAPPEGQPQETKPQTAPA